MPTLESQGKVASEVEVQAEKSVLDTKHVDVKLVDGKLQVVLEVELKSEIEKLAAKTNNSVLKKALELIAGALD